jgi:hypothetical protein
MIVMESWSTCGLVGKRRISGGGNLHTGRASRVVCGRRVKLAGKRGGPVCALLCLCMNQGVRFTSRFRRAHLQKPRNPRRRSSQRLRSQRSDEGVFAGQQQHSSGRRVCGLQSMLVIAPHARTGRPELRSRAVRVATLG